MLFRDVVKLVGTTWGEDEWGYPIEIPTRRQVFANRKSVRQSEFYQAAIAGLKPEIMFEVRTVEYRGEKSLEHEGTEYNIIRTYDKNGEITELICAGLVNPNGDA